MTANSGQSRRSPRKLLSGIGTLGAASSTLQEAESTPEWAPPSIPQPLPTPGGAPPTPVGAAAPVSAEPQQILQPESDLTATPSTGTATPSTGDQAAGLEAGEPAAPAEGAATPVQEEAPQAAAIVTLTPDFAFDPAEVTVSVGQSVAWTTEGRSPQTVTCDPNWTQGDERVQLPQGAEPFDSGPINNGDTFEHTFDVAGEYGYISMNGAVDMSGRVVVQE